MRDTGEPRTLGLRALLCLLLPIGRFEGEVGGSQIDVCVRLWHSGLRNRAASPSFHKEPGRCSTDCGRAVAGRMRRVHFEFRTARVSRGIQRTSRADDDVEGPRHTDLAALDSSPLDTGAVRGEIDKIYALTSLIGRLSANGDEPEALEVKEAQRPVGRQHPLALAPQRPFVQVPVADTTSGVVDD